MRSLVYLVLLGIGGCASLIGLDDLEVVEPALVVDASPDVAVDADADMPEVDAGEADAAIVPLRVFVTESQFSGDLGGLGGADDACQDAANAAGIGSRRWVAWLTIAGKPAIDRIPADTAYTLVDGTPVVETKAELVSGRLASPIRLTERGSPPKTENRRVWTGTRPAGTEANHRCGDWTSASATTLGETGLLDDATEGWTDDTAAPISCGGTARLYCFEQ